MQIFVRFEWQFRCRNVDDPLERNVTWFISFDAVAIVQVEVVA